MSMNKWSSQRATNSNKHTPKEHQTSILTKKNVNENNEILEYTYKIGKH